MAKQQNHPARVRLAFILTLICAHSSMAIAQDLDSSPRKPNPFPNSFGRFVNPPASPRILEPTPPRETKGIGGFFMPLKSFSNPFRSSNRTTEYEEEPPLTHPEKPIREPFSGGTERRTKPEVSQLPKPESKNGSDATQTPTKVPSLETVDESEGSVPSNLDREAKADAISNNTLNRTKTYTANPKAENLDSVGTSRRTKSTTAVKRSFKSDQGESDQGESDRESETIAKRQATKETTKSDEIAPPEVPKGKLIQSDSAQNQNSLDRNSSARKKSSNATTVSNRPKNQGESNIGFHLQAPGLNLSMTGPDSILVGKAAPYELVATNEGKNPLQGLSVRLLVPTNVTIEDPAANDGIVQAISDEQGRGVVWELKALPANTKQSLRIMVRTDQPEHFAMSLDWKIENPVVQIPVRVQQPQLILALEGASEADFGKPQTYRLRVRNPGNATAKDVRIQLQAEPNGSSEEILGDLPPGTERVVEVELTFQQAGKNQILAKATSVASNLEASRNIDVDVRQSQLVASWIGPDEFYQGNVADYTLALENRGTIDSLDNQCRINLPADVEVVHIPPGVSLSENQLRWDLPKIAVGEKLEWKFQFVMNRSGRNNFTLEADSSSGEQTQTTIQTNVDAVADLSLSVNDPISPAPVGTPVVYTITIINRGKKVAEDVFVIAQFSDGIEPVRIEGHSGKLVPGQALFDTIPKIEPGQELSLRVTAQASKPGTHRFRAAVRCQGSEDDLLKEESTRYATSGNASTKAK